MPKNEEPRPLAWLDRHLYVLLLIYYWRYVDPATLQQIYPNLFSARSTLTYRLQSLRKHGYVKVAQAGRSTAQDLHSVTRPAVELLQQRTGRPLVYTRDETVSPFLLEHERLVSHFQTTVWHYLKARPDLILLWFERRYDHASNRLTYTDQPGKERTVIPDLGFLVIRQQPGGTRWPLLYLAEIDRGNERPEYFRGKLAAYDRWYEQQGRDYLTNLYHSLGAPQAKPIYRRLVIARARHDGNHLARLARLYTLGLTSAHSGTMYTTVDVLSQTDDRPSWYPISQARAWRHDIVADLPDKKRQRYVTNYATEKLQTMRRYTLLPPVA